MSKLYNTYLELKKKDKETIYLFKSGIFFISLDNDAYILSKLFHFKITNLTDTVVKCGFPCSSFNKYSHLFQLHHLSIKIIELENNALYSFNEYKQNQYVVDLLEFINSIEESHQTQKLNTSKPKILLVSHPYNVYDNYIGIPIIKKLEQMGIEIIYANLLNHKIAKMYAKNLSPTLYWTYSKELIGAIEYYQYSVDGIIFLTTFPCGPDSLVNELMLRKISNLPVTNILVDEQTSTTGLETRIESFIDIINERRKNNE